jgi:Holin of 3TMs, for gene-transfer release
MPESEKQYERLTASEKKKEDWMNSKWRPMMGWMYMCVCTFDFMIAPIFWSLLQSLSHGSVQTQWQPLTLQGAGLFHVAMGAVLGIAAYGRTQEKLNGANNGGAQLGTTYTPPPSTPGGSFGGSPSGFNSSPSGFTAPSAPAAGGFGSASSANAPATTSGFGPDPTAAAPAPTTGMPGRSSLSKG